MPWNESGEGSGGLEESFLAADLAEWESLIAYRRLRPLRDLILEAIRRADSAARLEAALRLSM